MSTSQMTNSSSPSSSTPLINNNNNTSIIPTSKPTTPNSPPPSEHHTNGGYIALSILGPIILFSLLGVIVFRYIHQRKRRHHQQSIKDSVWQKCQWDLMIRRRTYARVDEIQTSKTLHDGMIQTRGYDLEVGGKERRRGSVIMDWWRGSRISNLVGEEEEAEEKLKEENKKKKKKKQKLGTVHKVKRFKPNDAFEIDSDVRLSVDLTLVPSRSR